MSLSPLTRLSTTLTSRLTRSHPPTSLDDRPPTPWPTYPHDGTHWPSRATIEREAGYVLEYDDEDRHVRVEYHEVVACSRPASLKLTRQSGPSAYDQRRRNERTMRREDSRRLSLLRTACAAAKAWVRRSSEAVRRSLRPRRPGYEPVVDGASVHEPSSVEDDDDDDDDDGPVTPPAAVVVVPEIEDPRVRMRFREVAWGMGGGPAAVGMAQEGEGEGAPEVVEGRLPTRDWPASGETEWRTSRRSRLPSLAAAA